MRSFSSSIHGQSVWVACADGSEEMETVTIVDTLRRAHLNVNLLKVGSLDTVCKMSRGVKLV